MKIYSQILVAIVACFFTHLVLANPVGGSVAAGNASITQSGNNTLIQQTSDKAIINWQSFNISAGEKTHFQQPANGMALNRINPNQGASQIFGSLTATGKIILVNQAGIFFGPGSSVNVGGIIASTTDIRDQNFLAGKLIFDQPSRLNGAISNQGQIIAANHGLVALIGTGVSNEGNIQARAGNVVLASGDKFTIDLYGDQLINFSVDQATQNAAQDVNGNKLKHAVNNSGQIIADGGTILLTAKAAANVVDHVINMSGVAQAHSVGKHNGVIILSGGKSGKVSVSGTLNVASKKSSGGSIKVLGETIEIKSSANLDATGYSGGGEILIGGNQQGKGPEINAKNTSVESGAIINASATYSGDGGKVIVWADDHTTFAGSIYAMGGEIQGNGGFVETSGKDTLTLANPYVNASATNGKNGKWLLDPTDIIVDDAEATTISNTLNNGTDVVIQTSSGGVQQGDVTFNNTLTPVDWATNAELSVIAHNDIIFNVGALINNTNAALISLRADSDANSAGTIIFNDVNQIQANNGNVNLYYNPIDYATPTDYSPNVLFNGLGQLTSYMLVNNASDLQNINNNLNGTYALGTDITGVGVFNMIGSAGSFNGIFEGLGHTIEGVSIINDPNVNIGFFSSTNGAVIQNFTLSNLDIQSAGIGINLGGLIGNAFDTEVNNITLSGNINSSGVLPAFTGNNIGGVIGFNNNPVGSNSVIQNISSTVNITVTGANDGGGQFIGGIIGNNFNTALVNVSNSGDINVSDALTSTLQPGNIIANASQFVGGIVGSSQNTLSDVSENLVYSGHITVNSDNTGGYQNIGGIIASNQGSVLTSMNSASVDVTGNLSTIYLDGPFSNFANQYVGGVFGRNYDDSQLGFTFLNLSNSGAIHVQGSNAGAGRNIGGLMGSQEVNSLVDSGNTGAVEVNSDLTAVLVIGTNPQSASESIGGLLGNYYVPSAVGILQNVTSFGAVTVTGENVGSTRRVGGLIGSSSGFIDDAHSFGDISVTSNLSGINLPGASNVQTAGEYVGGLIGTVGPAQPYTSDYSITNSTSFSSITVVGDAAGLSGQGSYINVGGLIGINSGDIANSSSNNIIVVTSDVSGNGGINLGGLSGTNYNYRNDLVAPPYPAVISVIANSSSSSQIILNQNTQGLSEGFINYGGVVGFNEGELNGVSNSGSLTLNMDLLAGGSSGIDFGGVVGFNNAYHYDDGITNAVVPSVVQNTHNTGDMSYNQINVGMQGGGMRIAGLIGGSYATITDSTSSGMIIVNTDIQSSVLTLAGLVGGNYYNSDSAGSIDNSSSSTNIFFSQMANGIQSGSLIVGGLVGSNQYIINDSTSSGSMIVATDIDSGGLAIGGLVANNENSAISKINDSVTSSNIFFSGPSGNAQVWGSNVQIGGLTGANSGVIDQSNIQGPSTTGTIDIFEDIRLNGIFVTNNFIGGLSGIINGDTVTTNLINTRSGGTINLNINNYGSVSISGGMVGLNQLGIIEQSASTTGFNVTGSNDNGILITSGFAGGNFGSIAESYSTGAVNVNVDNTNGGLLSTGGFIGVLINIGFGVPTIENSYSQSLVSVTGSNTTGSVLTGGFAGTNGLDAIITAPLSHITPGPIPGGIIDNAYSTGQVSVNVASSGGQIYTGGFIGNLDPTGEVNNSFWDTTTSGQASGIGAGTPNFLTGGCFAGAPCVNGGVANLSQVATYSLGSPYLQPGTQWDFNTVWGIINNQSYPFLRAFNPGGDPRIISGTAPVGSTVSLVYNGQIIDSTSVGANSLFYFAEANGLIADNALLLTYLTNTLAGNLVFQAPSGGGNITNLSLLSGQLTIGTNAANVYSNTLLAGLVGNVSDPAILLSALGSDIYLGNFQNMNFAFSTTPTSAYVLNGGLQSIIGSSTSITFNGPLVIQGDQTIFGNAITIANSLSGSDNLSIVGNGVANAFALQSSPTIWSITGSKEGNITGLPNFSGNLTFADLNSITDSGNSTIQLIGDNNRLTFDSPGNGVVNDMNFYNFKNYVSTTGTDAIQFNAPGVYNLSTGALTVNKIPVSITGFNYLLFSGNITFIGGSTPPSPPASNSIPDNLVNVMSYADNKDFSFAYGSSNNFSEFFAELLAEQQLIDCSLTEKEYIVVNHQLVSLKKPQCN